MLGSWMRSSQKDSVMLKTTSGLNDFTFSRIGATSSNTAKVSTACPRLRNDCRTSASVGLDACWRRSNSTMTRISVQPHEAARVPVIGEQSGQVRAEIKRKARRIRRNVQPEFPATLGLTPDHGVHRISGLAGPAYAGGNQRIAVAAQEAGAGLRTGW